MKIEVAFHEPDGEIEKILPAEKPYIGATYVYCDVPCPHCEAPRLAVTGFKGTRVEQDDCIYEAAGCRDCGEHIGTIKVEILSLFGEEEDRSVLYGRMRVY